MKIRFTKQGKIITHELEDRPPIEQTLSLQTLIRLRDQASAHASRILKIGTAYNKDINEVKKLQ